MKELTFSDAKKINGGDGGLSILGALALGVAGSLIGAFIWESIDDHEGTSSSFSDGYNSTRR